MQQSEQRQERFQSDERKIDQTESKQSSSQKNIPNKNDNEFDKKIDSQKQIQQKYSLTQKTQQQVKMQASLQKISIQTPLKKQIGKNKQKNTEKPSYSLNKIIEKKQNDHSKDKVLADDMTSSKSINKLSMKSTFKSNQKHIKVNKPFYQETFYITGMKQNYLLLLSDNNQVLEFPIGMFTTQGGSISERDDSDNDSNEGGQNFHLMKDIKIGQPIKIKLQLDTFRQQKDQKMFSSLQKKIHEDYNGNQKNITNQNKKQISKKRS